MPEKIDLTDLLQRNPKIDRSQLELSKEFAERIRDGHFGRKTYDLSNPFGGRRIAVGDNAHSEDLRSMRDRNRVPDPMDPRV